MADLARARLLLFDLDGCLVDSMGPITTCINHALLELGLPVRDPADLRRFVGPPLRESFRTLLGEAGADRELDARCLELYRERYATESLETTTVVPGIPAVLEQLASLAPMAVVTSKPRDAALPLVEAVGLAPWFLEVHGPAMDLHVETKAVTLQRALASHAPELPRRAAVMIGDREHDIAAGIACGTETVGVTWGAGDRSQLEEAGADHIVTAPADLPTVLA